MNKLFLNAFGLIENNNFILCSCGVIVITFDIFIQTNITQSIYITCGSNLLLRCIKKIKI